MTLARVVIDWEALRTFASQVSGIAEEVSQMKSKLQSGLGGLESDWQDPSKQTFEENFQETLALLDKFCEGCEQHVRYLHEKASKAEELAAG